MSPQSKILVCSPSETFTSSFPSHFEKEFEWQTAATPNMASFLAKEWEPALCLIDGQSAHLGLVRELRSRYPHQTMGLIVVTAAYMPDIEEAALKAGADHYVWDLNRHPQQLYWRINALLRRLQGPAGTAYSGGASAPVSSIRLANLQIFPNDFMVKRNNLMVACTPTQFRLLMAFLTHRDQLLTRDWLKENVWDNSEISPRSIDAQISKLKKLLPEIESFLVNIYGKGYVFSQSEKPHPGSEVA